MIRRSVFRDREGAAAAELALVTPLLIGLMFGAVELGNFFWNQHTLVKGARDGARYVARQRFSNFTACTGAPPQAIFDDTKTIVRTGTLDSNANSLLPNWSSATFNVTISCAATINTASGNEVPKGIYSNFVGGAPKVLVSVSLPYRPIIASMIGIFPGNGINLNASQSAAVAGL